MKEMFESEEAFTAHATIAAGYYMLKQLQAEAAAPVSGIIAAVDKACGHNRQLRYAKEAAVIVYDIMEAKKVIEADYSKEEQMILNLQKFIKDETIDKG